MVENLKPAKSRDQSRIEPQNASKRRTPAKQSSKPLTRPPPSSKDAQRASQREKGRAKSAGRKQVQANEGTELSRREQAQAHAHVLLTSPGPALMPTLPAPPMPSVHPGQVGELLQGAIHWLGGGGAASRNSLAPSTLNAATSTEPAGKDEAVVNSTEAPPLTSADILEELGDLVGADVLIFTKPSTNGSPQKKTLGLSGKHLLARLKKLPPGQVRNWLLQLGEEVEVVNGANRSPPKKVRDLLSEKISSGAPSEPGKSDNSATDKKLWADLLRVAIPEYGKRTRADPLIVEWMESLTEKALETDFRWESFQKQQEKLEQTPTPLDKQNEQGKLDNDYINVVKNVILKEPDIYRDFVLKTLGPASEQFIQLNKKALLPLTPELEAFIDAQVLSDPTAYSGFLKHYLISRPDTYQRFLEQVVDRAILNGGFTRHQTEAFLLHAAGGIETKYLPLFDMKTRQVVRGKAYIPLHTAQVRRDFFSEISDLSLTNKTTGRASEGIQRPVVDRSSAEQNKSAPPENLLIDDPALASLAASLSDSSKEMDEGLKQEIAPNLRIARTAKDFQNFLIPPKKRPQSLVLNNEANPDYGRPNAYQNVFLHNTDQLRWFSPSGHATPWISGSELNQFFDSIHDNSNDFIFPLLYAGNGMGPYVLLKMNDKGGRAAAGLMINLLWAIYETRGLNWQDIAHDWNIKELPRAKELVRAFMFGGNEPQTEEELRRGVQQYFFNQFRKTVPLGKL